MRRGAPSQDRWIFPVAILLLLSLGGCRSQSEKERPTLSIVGIGRSDSSLFVVAWLQGSVPDSLVASVDSAPYGWAPTLVRTTKHGTERSDGCGSGSGALRRRVNPGDVGFVTKVADGEESVELGVVLYTARGSVVDTLWSQSAEISGLSALSDVENVWNRLESADPMWLPRLRTDGGRLTWRIVERDSLRSTMKHIRRFDVQTGELVDEDSFISMPGYLGY